MPVKKRVVCAVKNMSYKTYERISFPYCFIVYKSLYFAGRE